MNDTALVYVDPEMWEKVVFNLIGMSPVLHSLMTAPSLHWTAGNAFKYTLQGTVSVKIRFSPLWATFQVTDTGVGIPPEDIDRSKSCPSTPRNCVC